MPIDDELLDPTLGDPFSVWGEPLQPAEGEQASSAPPRPRRYPDDVYETLKKARLGDRSVLPQVREIFDRYPEICRTLGDPLLQTERLLTNRLCGGDLAKEEALRRRLEEFRAGLEPESALERLLAGEIAINWLHVRANEQDDTLLIPDQRQMVYEFRRMSNRHLMAAIRTLAMIRKLERQSPSPLDLARRPVDERRPEGVGGKDRFTPRPPRAL